MSEDCEDYAKSVFLLNHGDVYYCSRCRNQGAVKKEKSWSLNTEEMYREVRVEFDYDVIDDKFKAIAILKDNELFGKGNVYYLQSPLVKTEVRALRMAESLLSHLMMKDGVAETGPINLCIDNDREEFLTDLKELEHKLNASFLSRNNV